MLCIKIMEEVRKIKSEIPTIVDSRIEIRDGIEFEIIV
jgi:hypothetical protein